MKIKIIILKKFISALLAVTLTFNPLLIRVSYAEEATPSAEQAPTSFPSDPTPTPTQTPDPILTPTPTTVSEIKSGDAVSNAINDAEVNINIATASGNLNTGDCPVSGQVSGCTNLENDNNVEATSSTTAVSETGDNKNINETGDAITNTGDASASADFSNLLNTNILSLESTNSAVASESASATDSAGLAEASVDLTNSNQATSSNTENVLAATGDNNSSASGNAGVNTGDAAAYANLLNLINTNILASDYKIIYLNINNQVGDINLYEEWLKLNSQIAEGNLTINVQNNNDGTLNNNVNVAALTGSNTAQGSESAKIQTGDAIAVANVVNFVNTNIIGSRFILGVINIFGTLTGNIILPSQEDILSLSGSSSDSLRLSNNSEAILTNSVNALAGTGNNNSTGSANSTNTGDALSKVNTFNLVNSNIQSNNWLLLLLNNLGLFNGHVLSWESPEAKTGVDSESSLYNSTPSEATSSAESVSDSLGASLSESTESSSIDNNNKARVENNINVTSDTGRNNASSSGETVITTGIAKSLANLVNVINTNIFSSNWLFGIINNLGKLNGNIIFAYPDVAINITHDRDPIVEGDSVSYTVSYENLGYKEAKDVSVNISFPTGVKSAEGPNNFSSTRNGQNLIVKLGSLKAKEKGSFQVILVTDENFNTLQNSDLKTDNSIFSKLTGLIIRPAMAKESGLVIHAVINNINSDANSSNNIASDSVSVEDKAADTSANADSDPKEILPPSLWVESSNNIGEFVYPGDIVTYEVKVKNLDGGVSAGTKLFLELTTQNGQYLGSTSFNIGDLDSRKGAKVNFGLPIGENFPAGLYFTRIYAVGFDEKNDKYTSNTVSNQILVKDRIFKAKLVDEAVASENQTGEGKVLAVENIPVGIKSNDRLPYILALAVALLWFIDRQNSGRNEVLVRNFSGKLKKRLWKRK